MTAAFDRIAPEYARLWTGTEAGRFQREATWHWIDPLFPPGSRLLDLGCGTGEDALHLEARGVRVEGIDASTRMVEIAGSRGVAARVLAIEKLAALEAVFDGVISNFGALNCVRDLAPVGRELARLVRPGGYAALCVLGNFCLWELAWYLGRLRPAKAVRRVRGEALAGSLGIPVYYPGAAALARCFVPHFRLVRWHGVGLTVPPSYVRLPGGAGRRLAALDRRLAHRRGLRALADHRLFVFQRI